MALTFQSTLKRTKIALLLSGIKLEDVKFGRILEFLFKNLFYFNFFWLGTDLVAETFGFIEGVQMGKNVIELALTAPCFSISLLGTAKSIFLFKHQNIVYKIILKLKNIHPESATENDKLIAIDNSDVKAIGTTAIDEIDNNNIEDKIVENSMKILNQINAVFNLFCSSVVIAFCLLPAATMAYTYYTTGDLVYEYPYLTKYFFNHYTLERWPLVYLHQVYSTAIVAANLLGADSLFHALCLYVEMHFQILCKRFEKSTVGDENTVHNTFMECVERHQELIELVNNMEILYTKSTLFNIVMSSILICLNGFILTIFLLCYFGDLIMKSSVAVSSAIYNSPWYNTYSSSKKNVLFVIKRAQKPCKLTACNYADLNLSAFATILSRSWSYFALLRSMYD
ncbi:odorant receptor 4 isoform X2 [Plodia interpunctella]|uniref:odorant receptor 4 isoform X2 n=1 Tax=Plodia interpunctella TaxID=58824 RepID=UPI002368E41F|nr:odorant receptor 4-like isoform X2 [Plodia interpunctella]